MPRNSKKLWLSATGAIAFLCLAGFSYFNGHSTMAKDEDTIRKLGIPSNVNELVSLAPTKGANAGEFYNRFARFLATPTPSQEMGLNYLRPSGTVPVTTMIPRAKLSSYWLDSEQAAIGALRPWVDLLAKGAAQPRWTVRYPESKTPRLSLPDSFADTTVMQNGINLLNAMAIHEAKYGFPLRGVEDLNIAQKIIGQLAANPGSDQARLALEWDASVMTTYYTLSTLHPKDVRFQSAIWDGLDHLSAPPSLRNAIIERYIHDDQYLNDALTTPINGVSNPIAKLRAVNKVISDTRPQANLEIKMWREVFEQLPADNGDWKPVMFALNDVNSKHYDQKGALLGQGGPLEHSSMVIFWQRQAQQREDVRNYVAAQIAADMRASGVHGQENPSLDPKVLDGAVKKVELLQR